MNDLKLMDFGLVNTQSPEELIDLNLEEILPGTQGEVFNQVQKVCDDKTISGHTRYQLEEFVSGDIGECVTNFGRIFQILRELSSRRSSIMQAKSQLLKSQGKLKMALAQKIEKKYALTGIKDSDLGGAAKLRAEGSLDMIEARIWESKGTIISSLEQAENAYREMLIFWELYQKYQVEDYKENFEAYDAREWRARTLMRAFTGKLNYIPPMGVEEAEDLIKLGVVMRSLNYSENQTAQFCERLWVTADLITEFIDFVTTSAPLLEGNRGPTHSNDFTMSSLNPGITIQEWAVIAEETLNREDFELFCNNVNLRQITATQRQTSPKFQPALNHPARGKR